VKDYQKSLRFYQSLGFVEKCHRKEDPTFIDAISAGQDIELTTTRLVSPDGGMIELLDYGKHTEIKPNTLFSNGIAHFAITVEDIDKLYLRLYRRLYNVDFVSPPKISPDGYAKVAFCQAPEGTFIELVEVL